MQNHRISHTTRHAADASRRRARRIRPSGKPELRPVAHDFWLGLDAALLANATDASGRRPALLGRVAALIIVILAMPVLAVIGAALKCVHRGPVLVWQQRLGRAGEPIRLLSFNLSDWSNGRSTANPAPQAGVVGRILRRSYLEHLPRLLSVVRGDLHWVGTSPATACSRVSADESRRWPRRPGLFCYAEMTGGSACKPAERIALQAWYERHRSVTLDSWILLLVAIYPVTGRIRRDGVVRQSVKTYWGGPFVEPSAMKLRASA